MRDGDASPAMAPARARALPTVARGKKSGSSSVHGAPRFLNLPSLHISPAPSTSLAPNRDRYHVIDLAGCELLVASTPDGRLDVSDAYVRDRASGLYARPGGEPGSGEPSSTLGRAWGGPRPAVVVPWETTFFGDALFAKAGWTRMERVFLIPSGSCEGSSSSSSSSTRPPLDFTAVACFDAATRVLELAEVKWEAKEGADPASLSLRIR